MLLPASASNAARLRSLTESSSSSSAAEARLPGGPERAENREGVPGAEFSVPGSFEQSMPEVAKWYAGSYQASSAWGGGTGGCKRCGLPAREPGPAATLELLEEALRDAPDDAYLLYQLGATQKTLGDPAAASSIERALALDSCGAVKALSPDAEADAWMRLAQRATRARARGRCDRARPRAALPRDQTR
jgi:hypothetical protein